MKKIIYQQITIFALRFLLCGTAGLLFSIINLALQPIIFNGQAHFIDEAPVLLYLPMIPGVILWHLVSEVMARSRRFNLYHERLFVIVWSALIVQWLMADYFPDMDVIYRSYILVANILLAWLAAESSFVLFTLIGARSKEDK